MFFLSNCASKEVKVLPSINQPSDSQHLQQTHELKNKNVEFTITDFSYNDFENFDQTLLSISESGLHEYAEKTSGSATIEIVNLDIEKHTFSIKVTLNNVEPTEQPINVKFSFTYNSEDVKTNDVTFVVTLKNQEKKQIFYPTTTHFDFFYRSTVLEATIPKFKYSGISDINKLTIIYRSSDFDYPVTCKVTDVSTEDKEFSIFIRTYGIKSFSQIDFTCHFEFYYDEEAIETEASQLDITIKADPSEESAEFAATSWDEIGVCANLYGIKGLQDKFKLQSLVGVTKTISVNNITHLVRVVAQDTDELETPSLTEGSHAALTFMFDDAITIQEDKKPILKSLIFDSTNNIWCSPLHESEIKKWLNQEFLLNLLPPDVSLHVQSVKKKTTVPSLKEPHQSPMSIWLPSMIEVGGLPSESEEYLLQEDQCYEYFENINSNDYSEKRVRTRVGGGEEAALTWLRTPLVDQQNNIVYCMIQGNIVSYNYYCDVSSPNGICPCFSF